MYLTCSYRHSWVFTTCPSPREQPVLLFCYCSIKQHNPIFKVPVGIGEMQLMWSQLLQYMSLNTLPPNRMIFIGRGRLLHWWRTLSMQYVFDMIHIMRSSWFFQPFIQQKCTKSWTQHQSNIVGILSIHEIMTFLELFQSCWCSHSNFQGEGWESLLP